MSKYSKKYVPPKVIEKAEQRSFQMNGLRLAGWGYGRLAGYFGIPPWEVGMHIAAARKELREQENQK